MFSVEPQEEKDKADKHLSVEEGSRTGPLARLPRPNYMSAARRENIS